FPEAHFRQRPDSREADDVARRLLPPLHVRIEIRPARDVRSLGPALLLDAYGFGRRPGRPVAELRKPHHGFTAPLPLPSTPRPPRARPRPGLASGHGSAAGRESRESASGHIEPASPDLSIGAPGESFPASPEPRRSAHRQRQRSRWRPRVAPGAVDPA